MQDPFRFPACAIGAGSRGKSAASAPTICPGRAPALVNPAAQPPPVPGLQETSALPIRDPT